MALSPLLSGIGKVVAVGGLMAAAGGSIYFIASTQDGDEESQVVAGTATISATDMLTSGTAEPELTASPDTTPATTPGAGTPTPAGNTDTPDAHR